MFEMNNEKKHIEDTYATESITVAIDHAATLVEGEDDNPDALSNMEAVADTANKIRKQNPFTAMFSSGKNDKRLAENDERILSVIRSMLNWLAVITSAETVRKDEYDSLTSQMIQFNDDMNERLEMDVKFKRAYETMMQKQEEQEELKKTVKELKKQYEQLNREHKESDLEKLVCALKKENMCLKQENKKTKILSGIATLLAIIAIMAAFII